MWMENPLSYEIASEIIKEIDRDRKQRRGHDTQLETEQTGYAQQPSRRFHFVAAFIRLFQRQQRDQTPAQETNTQHQTV